MMFLRPTRWPELDLQSYGRCSRNENGHVEVNADFHQTFWQWLLRKPATKKVWYFAGGNWFDKATGKLATNADHKIIGNIQYELNRIKWP